MCMKCTLIEGLPQVIRKLQSTTVKRVRYLLGQRSGSHKDQCSNDLTLETYSKILRSRQSIVALALSSKKGRCSMLMTACQAGLALMLGTQSSLQL